MSTNRETEDQITKIMGSYLLKGYTLLDTHCTECQTPLMKTKTSKDYCINCNEVNIKSTQKKSYSSNECSNGCAMSEDIKNEEDFKVKQQNELKNDSKSSELKEDIERTTGVVQSKMIWATNRLRQCDQINDCLQLIHLIKSSADLILTLNQLTRNQ